MASISVPSALASLGKTSERGGVADCSQWAMVVCGTPTAFASSTWVSPAFLRRATSRAPCLGLGLESLRGTAPIVGAVFSMAPILLARVTGVPVLTGRITGNENRHDFC